MNTKIPTIFFLTAIPLEYQAVKAHLEYPLESQWNSTQTKLYEIGEYLTPQQVRCRVVVRQQEKMGNLQALEETLKVIADFQPSYGFFVGIAAKLKDVELGDVVATTWVEGYEAGKIQEDNWQSRAPIATASKYLSEIARQLVRNEQWQDKIKPVPPPRKPKALVASIASGEKVVDSTEFLKRLRHNHSNAAALEMEGLGFLQALSDEPTVKGIVIRGISDAGEHKAETDKAGWQTTAACHAAAFAFAMLDELLDKAKELPLPPNPYPGLKAFRPEDAKNFFGRAVETQDLVEKVRHHPFVVVIGASGAGKSSLVFAGLMPALAAQERNLWLIKDFRLRETVSNQESRALRLYAPEETESSPLTQRFHDTHLPLSGIVNRILDEHPDQHSLLMVIDQFEELYTVTADRELQHRFLEWLLAGVAAVQTSMDQVELSVLLTLRADFLKEALDYPLLAAALDKYPKKMLGPIANEDLVKTVIEAPAQQLEVTFEEGLTERILQDLRQSQEIPLPLLQFALNELWEQQTARQLTHAAYAEIGGVMEALSRYANRVYEELKPGQEEALQHIFTQLVHPGDQVNTKRVATMEQIGSDHWALVRKLADARLVVTRVAEPSQQNTVELIHEVLISGWGRLRRWISKHREFRSWQDQLEEDIKRWEVAHRDEGALLRGARLVEAEEKLKEYAERVSLQEKFFIAKSIALREKEMEREYSRKQIEESLKASEAAIKLVKVRELYRKCHGFEQTFSRIHHDYRLYDDVLLLAVQAFKIANNRETQNTLLKTLLIHPKLQDILEGKGFEFECVTFSPDGKWLASGNRNIIRIWEVATGLCQPFYYDGTIHLWKIPSSSQPFLLRFKEENAVKIISIAFSPDNQKLAGSSGNGTIRLWEVGTGTQLIRPLFHEGYVCIAFNHDGKILASGSEKDSTVRLWDVATGQLLGQMLCKHENEDGFVNSVAFSPNGQVLASGSSDGTIRLWTVATRTLRSKLFHEDGNSSSTASNLSLVFSPNGQILVSVSMSKKKICLWEVATGSLLGCQSLSGYESSSSSDRIVFSPDGKMLAVGDFSDHTIRIWEVTTGQPVGQPCHGHESYINSMAFSSDGRKLVSSSGDSTIRLWDVATGQQLGQPLLGYGWLIVNISFDPDGQELVCSNDNNFLWKVSTAQTLLQPLRGREESILRVTYSFDGQKMASSNKDNMVRVWDATTGQPLGQPLRGHEALVLCVAFSPNGRMLASGSKDKTIRLWEVATGQLLGQPFYRHEGGVSSLAFSADGQTLASGSEDRTVCLWEVSTGQLLGQPFHGHEGSVSCLAFSADGQTLASGSEDKTIRLWKIASGQQLSQPLRGHEGNVTSIAFSDDDKKLLSSSDDDTIRLWEVPINSQPLLRYRRY